MHKYPKNCLNPGNIHTLRDSAHKNLYLWYSNLDKTFNQISPGTLSVQRVQRLNPNSYLGSSLFLNQNSANNSNTTLSSTLSYSTDSSVDRFPGNVRRNSSHIGDSLSVSTTKPKFSSNATLKLDFLNTARNTSPTKSFSTATSLKNSPSTDNSADSVYSKSKFTNSSKVNRMSSNRTQFKDIALPQATAPSIKINLRKKSLESITPLAVRITKYEEQLQLKRHEPNCPLFKKEYEQNIPINDLIIQMERKLANKTENKFPKLKSDAMIQPNALRVASPDRAKELVEKYFSNPNPKVTNR